jgi:outer membrane protein assembly factor BamB
MNRTHILLSFLVITLVSLSTSNAENWPQWRGLQQNGISHEQGLPLTWSKTENIAWRVPLPGVAPSTPIVWNKKIFLTSTNRNNKEILLLCIDATGKQLWQRTIDHGESEQLEKNNLAAPSPCTDGKHIWTLTGNGTVACYNFSSSRQWQFQIEDRYGKIDMPWSIASSPTLDGNLLYIQLFHLNSSRVIAVEKSSGEEVWNVERQTDAEGKCMRSYATPLIYRDDQREYLLTHGQDYIVALDLLDGSELWRCGDFHPRTGYDPMMHISSSPVIGSGVILVPSGANGNFQALRPDASGLITANSNYRLWNHYISPMRPSALIFDSEVYVCKESGVLHCLDTQTGEQHYKRALHRHTHHASPVYADGRIYFTARDGTVTIIKPGKRFEVLATNTIDEPISASPAISDGRIYLRTFEALYAVSKP